MNLIKVKNYFKGNILINGLNIKYDFNEIRRNIGFCPQFDLLWDQLTAYEHLYLFSVIKEIPYNLI